MIAKISTKKRGNLWNCQMPERSTSENADSDMVTGRKPNLAPKTTRDADLLLVPTFKNTFRHVPCHVLHLLQESWVDIFDGPLLTQYSKPTRRYILTTTIAKKFAIIGTFTSLKVVRATRRYVRSSFFPKGIRYGAFHTGLNICSWRTVHLCASMLETCHPDLVVTELNTTEA